MTRPAALLVVDIDIRPIAGRNVAAAHVAKRAVLPDRLALTESCALWRELGPLSLLPDEEVAAGHIAARF